MNLANYQKKEENENKNIGKEKRQATNFRETKCFVFVVIQREYSKKMTG